ncbi:hypothetical protein CVV38_03965 [Candidatus Peregrinibacteria bacterium HGW-Peregrinibacteria-1]|jgi:DNA repair protein RadC|nr:MAG: hypothetical protein CVV38_03965 [Candidatus Peregrinibacteria bacterium HGW-Peregrinibacteria-1]
MRIREKLLKLGTTPLSNEELLTLIIRTGTAKENALKISRKILKKHTVEKFPNLTLEDLQKIPGLGSAKSCSIIGSMELAKRILLKKEHNLLLSPSAVHQEMKSTWDKKREYCYVFFLNSHKQITQKELISVGTINSTLAHPREVFTSAIKNHAHEIIISHNHPSGNITPSPEDLALTKQLKNSGDILGIELIDHVIVTQDSFFSFKEQGLLEQK